MLIALFFVYLLQASGQSTAPVITLPNGTTLAVKIRNTVKAEKASAGDEILAESLEPLLVGGRIVIPSGARVVGHVIASVPHTREHPESILRIRFERAEWKEGSAPLNAFIVGQLGVKRKRHHPSDCFPSTSSLLAQPKEQSTALIVGISQPRHNNFLAAGGSTEQGAEPPCAVAGPPKFEDVIVRTLDDPPGATQLMSVKRSVSLPAGILIELRQVDPGTPAKSD